MGLASMYSCCPTSYSCGEPGGGDGAGRGFGIRVGVGAGVFERGGRGGSGES